MKKYGYGRVSTNFQSKNGNSLEAQEQRLKQEGCDELYFDTYTASTMDRPEFNKLINKMIEGDTLVVTKLDRLARNVREGIDVVQNLFKEGIKVHVLNIGLLENTSMGRFFIQTMLAVAELERNTIIERTTEGKMIARQKPDFKEGRPNKFSKKQIQHALELLENNSYKQVEQMTGISKSTLIRAKRKKLTETISTMK